MAENMADSDLLPTDEVISAYRVWANGGWGMIITGNVQVDPRHLGQARDIANNDCLDRAQLLDSWKRWASVCRSEGSATVVQISHPGRQSPAGAGTRGFLEKTLAPSAISLRLGKGIFSAIVSRLLFGTPRAMTIHEIRDVQNRFVSTAVLAAEAGFDGIELHGAHGYLLSQFLTAKTNRRTDEYGGTPAARAKIVVDIIQAIRKAVPPSFTVGIKFNSVDHQSSLALEECLQQLQLIHKAGIDFLEISGGSYEEPIGVRDPDKAPEVKKEGTKAREAFFLDFARVVRDRFPDVPLLVTGGFRSREAMESAITSGALDMVGIARPAVLDPSSPMNTLLDFDKQGENARAVAVSVRTPWLLQKIGNYVIGAGYETAWYGKKIKSLGRLD
ncbi:NADH:flavin oxidoreductase/NADH oxidase, N-terminal [Fusarium oxysporum f. sp. vasinfectum]|nr:NADH:flavin oxidoreductase/NADH oxidase, N-terminal [Fusarium oxysporum f. sp. vasinfectum]KAK2925334.1 NADH:flavin oxidoreductase/NADH oxidase, N-terminal [Fusarium oxysporum f. sp. vasinfectum]